MIISSFSSSMSSSSSTFSSWSDLPLDLLIIIRDKLKLYQRIDRISFRSVCSQWHAAMPVPSILPRYDIDLDSIDNAIKFTSVSNNRSHSISLPLWSQDFFSSQVCCSNRWIVFVSREDETLLFDPVSNHKLIFPRLSPELLSHYNNSNLIVPEASDLQLLKVVVSSSSGGRVAVAGMVEITSRIRWYTERRIAFCRHGNGQRWCFLLESSKGISDIALAGDGRFYAIGEDCKLYMLDERPPRIRLKRIKLMLPKHILNPHPDDPIDERLSIECSSMEKSGGSYLKIIGNTWIYSLGMRGITLKLDVTKLFRNSCNLYVACEAEWSDVNLSPYILEKFFTPSLNIAQLHKM